MAKPGPLPQPFSVSRDQIADHQELLRCVFEKPFILNAISFILSLLLFPFLYFLFLAYFFPYSKMYKLSFTVSRVKKNLSLFLFKFLVNLFPLLLTETQLLHKNMDFQLGLIPTPIPLMSSSLSPSCFQNIMALVLCGNPTTLRLFHQVIPSSNLNDYCHRLIFWALTLNAFDDLASNSFFILSTSDY